MNQENYNCVFVLFLCFFKTESERNTDGTSAGGGLGEVSSTLFGKERDTMITYLERERE